MVLSWGNHLPLRCRLASTTSFPLLNGRSPLTKRSSTTSSFNVRQHRKDKVVNGVHNQQVLLLHETPEYLTLACYLYVVLPPYTYLSILVTLELVAQKGLYVLTSYNRVESLSTRSWTKPCLFPVPPPLGRSRWHSFSSLCISLSLREKELEWTRFRLVRPNRNFYQI